MMSDLHLGMTPWSIKDTFSAQSLGEQAQLGESWGYRSFWLPEHHFSRGTAIPDPLMLLASVAAVTTTLRLGTTSYLLPLRQPILAAEQVAVLDQLSQGRVILGIGRGYSPELFDTFGVDRLAKRKLLRECLDVMQRAWRGEAVGEGEGLSTISPLPAQQPHPPIWVAAFGPLALKQAGSFGYPYLASPMETKERLLRNHKLHREACESSGCEKPDIVPIMRSMFCSTDSRLIERVRRRLDEESKRLVRGVDGELGSVCADDWTIVGDPAYVADAVERYKAELGVTHLVVTRLRIGGVQAQELAKSVELIASTLN